jgi:hypothetical protein
MMTLALITDNSGYGAARMGAIVLIALLLLARRPRRWLRRARARFGRVAGRRVVSMLLVFALSMIVAMTLSAAQWPEAHIHDEFSYLLAGDTFAHGRLKNPTHPMWEHFETIHEIVQPFYASKYPPGQGMFLALGQVTTGRSLAGVWLSVALGCAALTWMLQGWVGARWALLGGLAAAINPGVMYWGQCYFGGGVAFLGGALVLGALPRLASRRSAAVAAVMGLGMAILANSRPFEGAIVSALAGGWLLICTMRRGNDSGTRPASGPAERSSALAWSALALVLALNFVWMGYYNKSVTGSALVMPYQVHEAQYAVAPLFFWQKPRPEPVYRHEPIRQLHAVWEMDWYRQRQTFSDLLHLSLWKIAGAIHFFLRMNLLLLPLLALPWALWRNRWTVFALAAAVLFTLALQAATFQGPHYYAPAVPLGFVVMCACLREMHGLRLARLRVGRFLVAVICLTYLGTGLEWYYEWAATPSTGFEAHRAAIAEEYGRRPRKALMIVSYRPWHNYHDEWVYNAADIDGARVVWARDMGDQKNRELMGYFSDRDTFIIDGDEFSQPDWSGSKWP